MGEASKYASAAVAEHFNPETLYTNPLMFAPGAGYYYNNTGYYMLGMLIEQVSGKPYGQYLAERVFKREGELEAVQTERERVEVGQRPLDHGEHRRPHEHAEPRPGEAGKEVAAGAALCVELRSLAPLRALAASGGASASAGGQDS